MSKRKRGFYKKYLTDNSEEIPVTTKYSRLLSAKKRENRKTGKFIIIVIWLS